MKNKFQNNKGQFFIAAAIVIIISITAIFFHINSVKRINQANLEEGDIAFFVQNVKNEFIKVAELTLSNVSTYNGPNPPVDPEAAFDSNLSSFANFTKAQAYQQGILLNTSFARHTATATFMNATVNLSFLSPNAFHSIQFYAYSQIAFSILTGTLVKTPDCTFDVSAKKEYGEPLVNMTGLNFGFGIDADGGPIQLFVDCAAPTYTEKGNGIYTFKCTGTACNTGAVVEATVTDTRNIYDSDYYTVP